MMKDWKLGEKWSSKYKNTEKIIISWEIQEKINQILCLFWLKIHVADVMDAQFQEWIWDMRNSIVKFAEISIDHRKAKNLVLGLGKGQKLWLESGWMA